MGLRLQGRASGTESILDLAMVLYAWSKSQPLGHSKGFELFQDHYSKRLGCSADRLQPCLSVLDGLTSPRYGAVVDGARPGHAAK